MSENKKKPVKRKAKRKANWVPPADRVQESPLDNTIAKGEDDSTETVTTTTTTTTDESSNFIVEPLEGNDPASIAEERVKMFFREQVPNELMTEMFKVVGCECVVQAYESFMKTSFRITIPLQDAINKTYSQFFGERLKRTSCSSCMKRRIQKVRAHIKKELQL